MKSNVYKTIDKNIISGNGKITNKGKEIRGNFEKSPKKTKRKDLKEVKFKFRTKLKVAKGERGKLNKQVQQTEIFENKAVVDVRKVIPNINGEEVVSFKNMFVEEILSLVCYNR